MSAVFYVAATIALTASSQLLQKFAALRRTEQQEATSYFRDKYFWFALILLGIGMLTWLCALGSIEVSKGYALLSLNYFLVPLAAAVLFKERLSPRYWLGTAILCAGVLLIGHS